MKMNTETAFPKMMVEDEIAEAVKAAEKYLRSDYSDEEETNEDVWGANNTIAVSSIYTFFENLTYDGVFPSSISVKYTMTDEDTPYEDMGTHFIVYYGNRPILSIHFKAVIATDGFGYEGLLKSGFEKMAEAIFIYHRFKKDSLED